MVTCWCCKNFLKVQCFKQIQIYYLTVLGSEVKMGFTDSYCFFLEAIGEHLFPSLLQLLEILHFLATSFIFTLSNISLNSILLPSTYEAILWLY